MKQEKDIFNTALHKNLDVMWSKQSVDKKTNHEQQNNYKDSNDTRRSKKHAISYDDEEDKALANKCI